MSFWKLDEIAHLRKVATENSSPDPEEWAWLQRSKFYQKHAIIINDVTFQFGRTQDGPWFRRISSEISWKVTGHVRTVKMLKITLCVLFLWINQLNFNSLHGVLLPARLGFAFFRGSVHCVHSFTPASERPQKEGMAEGKLRHGWLQTEDDNKECRRMIQHPFRSDSMSTNLKTGNSFYVYGFTLSYFPRFPSTGIRYLYITDEWVGCI